jgi:hypothetical protein
MGGGVLWDLCGRKNNGTLTNGPVRVPGPNGFGAVQFDGTNDVVLVPHSSELDGMSAMTLSAWVRPSSTPSGDDEIVKKDGSYILRFGSSNSIVVILWGTGTAFISSSAGLAPNGVWTHLAVTYDGVTTTLWCNGAVVSTSGSATGSVVSTPSQSLAFGAGPDGSESYPGDITDIRLQRTVVPIPAIYNQTRKGHPDTLRRYPDRSWFLLGVEQGGGGGTTTLTADAGSFTLTGQDASLTQALRLDGAAGSFALTGQDATLDWDQKLTADAGSFSLSGQTANLLKNRTLTSDAGSFSLTGQTANLLTARKVTADAGSFTLSGQDVTFSTGEQGATDAGEFLLTGQNVNLLQNRLLTSDAGSFALTGQDVQLLIDPAPLQADAGEFVLTGQDAVLDWDQRTTADTGTYTFTGRSAVLLAPGDSATSASNLTTLHAG